VRPNQTSLLPFFLRSAWKRFLLPPDSAYSSLRRSFHVKAPTGDRGLIFEPLLYSSSETVAFAVVVGFSLRLPLIVRVGFLHSLFLFESFVVSPPRVFPSSRLARHIAFSRLRPLRVQNWGGDCDRTQSWEALPFSPKRLQQVRRERQDLFSAHVFSSPGPYPLPCSLLKPVQRVANANIPGVLSTCFFPAAFHFRPASEHLLRRAAIGPT